MLPDVDPEEGNQARRRLQRVLVGPGDHLQAARFRVVAEPAPARALDADGGRAELLLELVDAAERVGEGGAEFRAGFRRAGREVLPEDRVVDVAAAVEAERGLEGDYRAGRGLTGNKAWTIL